MPTLAERLREVRDPGRYLKIYAVACGETLAEADAMRIADAAYREMPVQYAATEAIHYQSDKDVQELAEVLGGHSAGPYVVLPDVGGKMVRARVVFLREGDSNDIMLPGEATCAIVADERQGAAHDVYWHCGSPSFNLSEATLVADPEELRKAMEAGGEMQDDDHYRHLAESYRDHWNTLGAAGFEVPEEELEAVGAELAETSWLLRFDPELSLWVVDDTEDGVERYAQARAPKGGVQIGGKWFAGGRWIPNEDMVKASPEEKARLTKATDDAAEKRKGRGSVDVEALKGSLAEHADRELSKFEIRRAEASFRSLKQHHGELTVHRLEELANDTQQALDAIDPESHNAEGLKEHFGQRLRAIHHQLGLAERHGITGKVEKPEAANAESKKPDPAVTEKVRVQPGVVSRWQTRGGRDWRELRYDPKLGFTIAEPNGAQHLGNVTLEEARLKAEKQIEDAATYDKIKMLPAKSVEQIREERRKPWEPLEAPEQREHLEKLAKMRWNSDTNTWNTKPKETENATQSESDAGTAGGNRIGGTEHERSGGGDSVGSVRQSQSRESRILTDRAEHTAPADVAKVPESLRPHLNEAQTQGAAKAIMSMDRVGGFLLADGTGVGKTRQLLAVSEKYAKEGKKVIIVAPAEVIKPDWKKGTIAGSYSADSQTMGLKTNLVKGDHKLAPGSIHVTTYNELGKLKENVDSDTVVIFDESHALKNSSSQRGKAGRDIAFRSGKVMYATATPADKPLHIAHLLRAGVFGGGDEMAKKFFGKSEDTYKKLGLRQVEIYNKHTGQTIKKWEVDPKIGSAEVANRISGLFDQMTKEGLMVQRSLSMDNVDAGVHHVELPDQATQEMKRAFDSAMAKGGGNKAIALMAMRRSQEPHKIPATVDLAKKELAEGRSSIIFLGRVNDNLGEDDEDGAIDENTAKLLKKQLIESGIPADQIGELHGAATATADAKKKAMNAFQSGKTKILISTIQSGGTGVNFDDTVGDKPRTILMMTPPLSANDMIQAAGRINRLSTKSNAKIISLASDHPIDQWNMGLLTKKMKTLGAATGKDVEGLVGGQGEVGERKPFDWGASLVRGKAPPLAATQATSVAKSLGITPSPQEQVKSELSTAVPLHEDYPGRVQQTSSDFKVRTNYGEPIADKLRSIGAKWDAGEKVWRVPRAKESVLRNALGRSHPENPMFVPITIPYNDKDEAKRRGGQWDPNSKKWVMPTLEKANAALAAAGQKLLPGPEEHQRRVATTAAQALGIDPMSEKPQSKDPSGQMATTVAQSLGIKPKEESKPSGDAGKTTSALRLLPNQKIHLHGKEHEIASANLVTLPGGPHGTQRKVEVRTKDGERFHFDPMEKVTVPEKPATTVDTATDVARMDEGRQPSPSQEHSAMATDRQTLEDTFPMEKRRASLQRSLKETDHKKRGAIQAVARKAVGFNMNGSQAAVEAMNAGWPREARLKLEKEIWKLSPQKAFVDAAIAKTSSPKPQEEAVMKPQLSQQEKTRFLDDYKSLRAPIPGENFAGVTKEQHEEMVKESANRLEKIMALRSKLKDFGHEIVYNKSNGKPRIEEIT